MMRYMDVHNGLATIYACSCTEYRQTMIVANIGIISVKPELIAVDFSRKKPD
jgi:hypothetical protein